MTLLAARGAGYPWGLAEEAAKSARWLARSGVPWLPSLLAMLAAPLWNTELRSTDAGIWPEKVSDLSPFSAGAYISDTRLTLPIRFHRVRHPAWLLPFISVLAQQTQASVETSWLGVKVVQDDRGFYAIGSPKTLLSAIASEVRVALTTSATSNSVAVDQAAVQTVDPAGWQKLEQLAARTYVPSTEVSRVRDAGAGTLDGD